MKHTTTRTTNQQKADALHGHAKRCTKRIEECSICQLNVQFFASQSLSTLTEMSEDVPASRGRNPFIALVLSNYLDRTTHASKRGVADAKATAQLLTTAGEKDEQLRQFISRGTPLN